jgi:hypothetical protein
MITQVQLFQAFVAPAIFASASGLIILTLNARLLGIVNRIRAFNQHLQDSLLHNNHPEATMLEAQIKTVVERASMVRNALLMNLGGVVLIMATCLVLGLSLVIEKFLIVGITMFIFAILSMMSGLLLFMKELSVGLSAAVEEGKMRKSISSSALTELASGVFDN